MTIASSTSKSGPYACNGVTATFAISFACFAAADLYVVRTDADGLDTYLTYITDYSVALNADQTNSPGGTVTLAAAPATGFKVTILRNVSETQGTSLPNQGGWYPKVVEAAFDRLTMMVQQLRERVDRSLQVGVTDANPTVLTSLATAAALTAEINARIAAFAALASNAGASLLGFMQAGIGAILRSIQDELRERVSITQFGGLGDGAADNSDAIEAAETQCGPGVELVWPAGTYNFSRPISITRQKPRWTARGKVELVYTGASTTADLITIGDGVTSIIKPFISKGFYLRSTATMTAGTGLHLRRTVRGEIGLIPQGQDNFETYGNKLWNGIWYDQIDNMASYPQEVYAQNDGVRVNGTVGAGPKADLYLNYMKVAECAVGLRVGGAFGGAYINHPNFINNGKNIVIDQTLAAENNREVFITGGAVDVTTSGPGIYLNDAGAVLVQINGTWIASALTHGIHIASFGGKVIINGVRLFNCGGDGIRNDTATPYILINGGQIHNNVGYGINPNVAGHKMSWPGVQVMNNTAGNINTTNASAVDAELGYVTTPNIKATRLAFDTNWYHQLQSANPLTNYDANDYSVYDRTANRYDWNIGGARTLAVSADGSVDFGASGAESLKVAAAGGATTRWGMHGGAGFAYMVVDSSATNAEGYMLSKGTGALSFCTAGDTARKQFQVLDTPSATRALTATGSNGGNPKLSTTAGSIDLGAVPLLPSYTVATLPSASARGTIYVSDGTSNKRLAVAEGTNWRWPDGAIVS